mgnify:CR=1 FL=1
MDLSIKWLKEFVDIDYKARDFAEALTMSGSKVEGYTTEGAEISGVVIGKINSIDKQIESINNSISRLEETDKTLDGYIDNLNLII